MEQSDTVKKSEMLNQEKEQSQMNQSSKNQDALEALRRLRKIGEKLPTVDAAAVIREGRDVASRDSR